MTLKTVILNGLSDVTAAVLEYDTPKIVHIKDKRIGCLHRIIQLCIIIYIVAWGIVYQKGYQITGPVTGTITTKVKGAFFYNGSLDYMDSCEGLTSNFNRVFDAGDYVNPPEEPNSFFVMTNLWRTCNQTQSECAESPNVFNSNCTLDLDHPDVINSRCVDPGSKEPGYVFESGNGPTTGRCVKNPLNDSLGQCEVRAWCNVEMEDNEITNAGPKIDISNFTVLVKNSIEFPLIQKGLRKRNIVETADPAFLRGCIFNSSNHTGLYCPIFKLSQIISMIGPTKEVSWNQTISNISVKGGVVGLEIHWNCDHLEFNLNHCHPKYVAKRYDDPSAKISQGFNFRYSQYYYEDGVQKRILTKAYGILFKLEINGIGGKFDFITLVLKLGSMIALLSIASIVSDVLMLYIVKARSFYRQKKYLSVGSPQSDYVFIDEKDTDKIQAKGIGHCRRVGDRDSV